MKKFIKPSDKLLLCHILVRKWAYIQERKNTSVLFVFTAKLGKFGTNVIYVAKILNEILMSSLNMHNHK